MSPSLQAILEGLLINISLILAEQIYIPTLQARIKYTYMFTYVHVRPPCSETRCNRFSNDPVQALIGTCSTLRRDDTNLSHR